ncbi:MAG: Crp/Fnr family transcriptional regulator [Deltaproteobacteria bacterium]|nr:Crp/Fnr family transcriptional regulator [Deltaproteobacteria bacterium]MBW1986573.1 Crp/Fnr family transcriptional regulator [Deltaproteobacteria bacterium]MBW2133731.1 Crp/Fnr family transcriptional regulator [Deltaproteobacteria bacterium]
MRIPQELANIPLFEGLSEEQYDELAAIVLDKVFHPGQTIFSEGDDGDGFYVVVAGRVKIFKLSLEGKEQILHIFGAGEPFGEVPVFAGQRFPANAEALDDCRLFFFPRNAFVELIKRNPSLALNMLAVLSRRLRQFTQLIEDLSLKEVPGRLAAYLLYLSHQQGGTDEVKLDIPKNLLASLLGTIPETLSRILAKMIRQGLIEAEGPRIRIIDRPGLHDLAVAARRLS